MASRIEARTAMLKFGDEVYFKHPHYLGIGRYRSVPIKLTDNSLTGYYKEVTEITGIKRLYIQAIVTYNITIERTVSTGRWFFKKYKTEEYEKEVIKKVWIPEEAISFERVWDNEETIFRCGGR